MVSPSPAVTEVILLRERLIPRIRGPLQLPEPNLRLDLESRQNSDQRRFKHIHQSCVLHAEHFRTASQIKHLYLLDAYVDMAESENPLGVYMVARSMLEFNAFLHEVSTRLCEAAALAAQQWIDGGRKFFSIVVRARYATSKQDYRVLLTADGLPKDLQKPMNVKRCIQGLSGAPGFQDVVARYDSLCDFVHHNLGSATVANAGTAIADAARSAEGGMIIMPNPGPVTQYQYPVPSKAQRALDETGSQFINDARACIEWINMIPWSPYSREQVESFTGSSLGMSVLRQREAVPWSSPRVSRNAPCPCGSGRKYKQCCLK